MELSSTEEVDRILVRLVLLFRSIVDSEWPAVEANLEGRFAMEAG